MRRTWQILAFLALTALLAACTAIGGAGAGALGGAAVLLALMLAVSSQTGCIEDPPEPDPDDAAMTPCLSADASVGPCLSQVELDASVTPCLGSDIDFGACLDPDMSFDRDFGVDARAFRPDVGRDDPDLGVCLSPIERDFDVDADVGDCLAPDAAFEPDFPIGPCLDIAPDAQAALERSGPAADRPGPAYAAARRPDARQRILDRLVEEGRLPDDVAARLKQRT